MQPFNAGPVEGASLIRDLDQMQSLISEWLLGSLPEILLSKRTWIISPDGPLSVLPFETLIYKGTPLIENHDIASIHSLSVLRLAHDRARSYREIDRLPLLAIGNPVYQQDSDRSTTPALEPKRGLDVLRAASSKSPEPWRNLPGSAQELAALGKLFELRDGLNLFQGAAASEATVRRLRANRELDRYRFVVFATHGYLDRQNPDLSGIVLSQQGLDDVNDGYLRAAELAGYQFRSDLIVISACETGLGTWVSGEGILGLPFALYVGGNNSTLMTLWPIFDGSTADFIERFFRKVRDGSTFIQALSQTKREFARGDAGKERTSPAVWAPFVLYGAVN